MSSTSKPKSYEKRASSETRNRRQDGQRPPIEQPTPIIITGGSPLIATSEVVAWGDWTNIDDHRKRHPLGARRITRVLFKDDNNPALPAIELPVPMNGKCTVTVVYELVV